MEILRLKNTQGNAVELVDNDETASQIAYLVSARYLVILTEPDGIYREMNNPSSLIERIEAGSGDGLIKKIDEVKLLCSGASRKGANGAWAKLEYIKPCALKGTTVFIASAKYDLDDIVKGAVPSTVIKLKGA